MSQYSAVVIQAFFHPTYLGVLENNDKTHSVCIGSVAEGAVVRLDTLLDAKYHVICARFKVWGDPIVVAGLDWLCGWLIGQKIQIALKCPLTEIASALSISPLDQDKLIWVDRVLRGMIHDCCNTT